MVPARARGELQRGVARADSDPVQQRRHLRALTSFRFLAALAVFLHHASDPHRTWSVTSDAGRAVVRFLHEGGPSYAGSAGVTFFFVLSGFILAYSYGHHAARPTRASLARFYAARVARIYPVYLATFLLALPWAVLTLIVARDHSLLQFGATGIVHALLLQGFVPLDGGAFSFYFNGPAWSLSAEFAFYACFPLLLWLLARRAGGRAQLLAIATATWGTAATAAWLLRDAARADWLFYVFPPMRLADFVVGVCLGLLFLRSGPVRVRRTLGATALEAGVLAALVVAFAAAPLVPATSRYGTWYIPFMAAVVWVFAHARGHLSQALEHRGLVALGEISFCFYMLHVLLMNFASPAYAAMPLLTSVVVFCVTMATATWMYRRLERPWRSRIRHAAERRIAAWDQPAPDAAAPVERRDAA